jgi:8-oxo-dGTP pyrophosphatase MutT (NUDIX family)
MWSITGEGAKHYTASVIIISTGKPRKVLLVHHRKLDTWTQPGGHQEVEENAYEAAIREAQEETGIDITPYLSKPERLTEHAVKLPLPSFILEETIPAHGEEPEHYHLDMNYIVHLPEQAVAHDERELHDIRWFTAEELAEIDTFEDLRPVLERELAK